MPEDIENSDHYILVPHQSELDLRLELAYRFTEDFLSDEYNSVRSIFRRRGAYRRFKDLLEHHGILEKWYTYSDEAQDDGMISWSKTAGIELVG